MTSVKIGMYTMNAGFDVAGSCIRHILESDEILSHFDEMILLEGRKTEQSDEYYKTITNPKVRIINSPWQDSHYKQYLKRLEFTEEGDWIFTPDDDELPSEELLQLIDKIRTNDIPFDIVRIPSIVSITDDLKEEEKIYYESDPHPRRRRGNTAGRNMLMRKCDNVTIHHANEFHCEPVPVRDPSRFCYQPLPVYHLKSAYTYVVNDCVNAFISPKQERFTEEEANRFKECLRENNITNMQELRDSVKNNSWSDSFKEFAISTRHHNDRPVSRLFYWYFLYENPQEDTCKDITLEQANKHVLGGWWNYYLFNKKKNNFFTVKTTPML